MKEALLWYSAEFSLPIGMERQMRGERDDRSVAETLPCGGHKNKFGKPLRVNGAPIVYVVGVDVR